MTISTINNFDIYDYFNSPDVVTHCRNIDEGCVFHEVTWPAFDYMYYRGDLPENKKILKYIGNYFRNEMDIDQLLNLRVMAWVDGKRKSVENSDV
jgi:hypothetical protein